MKKRNIRTTCGKWGDLCKHALFLKLKQGKKNKQTYFSSKLELVKVSYEKE